MAYTIETDRQCDRCKRRRAVLTVRNSMNATVGYYCRPCGKVVVRQVALQEIQARENRQKEG